MNRIPILVAAAVLLVTCYRLIIPPDVSSGHLEHEHGSDAALPAFHYVADRNVGRNEQRELFSGHTPRHRLPADVGQAPAGVPAAPKSEIDA